MMFYAKSMENVRKVLSAFFSLSEIIFRRWLTAYHYKLIIFENKSPRFTSYQLGFFRLNFEKLEVSWGGFDKNSLTKYR